MRACKVFLTGSATPSDPCKLVLNLGRKRQANVPANLSFTMITMGLVPVSNVFVKSGFYSNRLILDKELILRQHASARSAERLESLCSPLYRGAVRRRI